MGKFICNLYWEMGFPFMKKYVFNYNYDNKLISFYNSDIKEIEKKNSTNNFKKGNIILIIIFGIIVCILGFIIGRRKITKKNKLTAKELESDFSPYNEDNNDIPYKYQE